MTQQYVYGALNRLEEAVNGAGKAAKYQYNGLGHRVGKLEGTLSKGKLEGLDPRNGIKAETEIGNWSQIHYTIDLTGEYHNLLEKTEGEKRQTYFWDGNVASYEENGRQSYYLQDKLGSPLKIEDELGEIKESYGYGAFGEELYGNQGKMQPFGYTGYQRDKVAGTYYAQAREYQADAGRFQGMDLIPGVIETPFSINRYIYCYNKPIMLSDLNGKKPVSNNIPTENECTHGFFGDINYGDIEGPNINLNVADWFNDKKGRDIGIELLDISGGLSKIGYKDGEGLFQGTYFLEYLHGDINASLSSDYVGLKAQGTCVTAEGKIRVLELFGKRIYIGASIDIISLGAKAGFDPDENKLEIGIGLGVGGGVSISWEDATCND